MNAIRPARLRCRTSHCRRLARCACGAGPWDGDAIVVRPDPRACGYHIALPVKAARDMPEPGPDGAPETDPVPPFEASSGSRPPKLPPAGSVGPAGPFSGGDGGKAIGGMTLADGYGLRMADRSLVRLTRSLRALLDALWRAWPETVPAADLIEACWPGPKRPVDPAQALCWRVCALRIGLERVPLRIAWVRGAGYRLEVAE